MTSDENTAEQAAKAYRAIWLNDTPGIPWENLGRSARATYIDAMRRFADDGWLADPADRDEWLTKAITERDAEYRKYAQEADRAEALEAEVARLRKLLEELGGTA